MESGGIGHEGSGRGAAWKSPRGVRPGNADSEGETGPSPSKDTYDSPLTTQSEKL